MKRRFARMIAWLGVALGAAACSNAALTRLAYNNAAFAYGNLAPMLAWMVDEYVDIDGAREDWVRARLDRVMAWHRAEELPRYRAFFESVPVVVFADKARRSGRLPTADREDEVDEPDKKAKSGIPRWLLLIPIGLAVMCLGAGLMGLALYLFKT